MSSSYSYQKLSGADEEERPEAQPAGAAEQPQAQQAAPASHSLQNSQSQASAASAAAPQWQFPTVTATEVPYAVPGPQFVPQTYGGAALGGPAAYGGGLNGWALPEFISPRAYRGWRGSLFSIAGDGSSRDWSICCIGAPASRSVRRERPHRSSCREESCAVGSGEIASCLDANC